MFLKIPLPQDSVTDRQAEDVKGNNFVINGSIKKKAGLFFFIQKVYIKFQDPTQIGFQDTVGT